MSDDELAAIAVAGSKQLPAPEAESIQIIEHQIDDHDDAVK